MFRIMWETSEMRKMCSQKAPELTAPQSTSLLVAKQQPAVLTQQGHQERDTHHENHAAKSQ